MTRKRAYGFKRLKSVVCVLFLIGVLPVACGSPASSTTQIREQDFTQIRGEVPLVLAFGDSLTAGLGLSSSEAYPALLQERLDEAGYQMQVMNAGVSGETTAGGLRRISWVLGENSRVQILILALGGNDGLRGLPVDQMKDNLGQIILMAQTRGVHVLLAGMKAPPNFGTVYTENFQSVFKELNEEYDVVFLPFLLDGVAGVTELNQSDGIHPNEQGAERVAAHVWPVLESMLKVVPVSAQ